MIGNDSEIQSHSWLFDSSVGNNSLITPFAKISFSHIGDTCKIGCEMRKSTIGNNVKASHTTILIENVIAGNNINFGGVFTAANYDGKQKATLRIGNNCFLGTYLVAVGNFKTGERVIGDNTYIAANITLRNDVPSGHTVYPTSIAKHLTTKRPELEIISQNPDYTIIKWDKVTEEGLLQ